VISLPPVREVSPNEQEKKLHRDLQGKVRVWDITGDGPTVAATYCQESGLYGLTWIDNGTVCMLTDLLGPQFVAAPRTNRHTKEVTRIWKPAPYHLYNQVMGYCDYYDEHALRHKDK